ncbi:glycosyltransferase [Brevibacillus ginsengisoli]|uniref:glycosyltransferase n=1 Tax=Brevibacillus ginsengisoli TaxID=363854 RepID=UPI003CF0745C
MKTDGVTIITCTNKPYYMDNIFDNYHKQLWDKKELIIILNRDDFDLNEWTIKASGYPDVSVFQLESSISLGRCLNFGVEKSKYPYIAKFDDDDFYSPYYLRSSIRAFNRTKADIVGKRSYYTFFEEDKALYIRFPNRERSYQKRVAGATIMFKKKVFKQVSFRDVTLGEDYHFLNDCRRKGFKIYSTNRYNYVSIRRSDPSYHTWIPTKEYIRGTGKFVAYTDDFYKYSVRPISRMS